MDYLELVSRLMDMGLDEESAYREATAELYPEKYEPTDYE